MTGAKCGRESFESFPQPSSSATNGVINRSLSSLASLGTGEASAGLIQLTPLHRGMVNYLSNTHGGVDQKYGVFFLARQLLHLSRRSHVSFFTFIGHSVHSAAVKRFIATAVVIADATTHRRFHACANR